MCVYARIIQFGQANNDKYEKNTKYKISFNLLILALPTQYVIQSALDQSMSNWPNPLLIIMS